MGSHCQAIVFQDYIFKSLPPYLLCQFPCPPAVAPLCGEKQGDCLAASYRTVRQARLCDSIVTEGNKITVPICSVSPSSWSRTCHEHATERLNQPGSGQQYLSSISVTLCLAFRLGRADELLSFLSQKLPECLLLSVSSS